MPTFKIPMKKYLSLLYVLLSVVSFAQFKENAFENEQSKVSQENTQDLNVKPAETASGTAFGEESSSDSALPPGGGDHPEGPGNPGEPVPINGIVPVLLLSGLILAVYYQRKNNKINI